MEGNMVEEFSDNTNYIYPADAIALVKAYFKENLQSYSLIKEDLYTGYWWIEYASKNMTIYFDGDIGGVFHVDIIIDGKKFPLWQYDRGVINAADTNKKNILYVLNVIKRFLGESNI